MAKLTARRRHDREERVPSVHYAWPLHERNIDRLQLRALCEGTSVIKEDLRYGRGAGVCGCGGGGVGQARVEGVSEGVVVVCGVVWCGVVWVWCGVVWCGVVPVRSATG